MFEDVNFGDGGFAVALIVVSCIIALVVITVFVVKFGPRLVKKAKAMCHLVQSIRIWWRLRKLANVDKPRWRWLKRISLGLLALVLVLAVVHRRDLFVGANDALQYMVSSSRSKLIELGVKDQPNCNDGNVCTDEYYDVEEGRCVRSYNNASCNDGDPCMIGDLCEQGRCVGQHPKDCDDGDPCTTDTCDPTSGCQHSYNTADCDDGDACTQGDVCREGDCISGERVICNDDNVCTDDSCDSKTGQCVYTNNTADCFGGDKCWKYARCQEGFCRGEQVDCNDHNPRTIDTCDPTSGCQHKPKPRTRKAKAPKAKKPKKPRSTSNLKCIPADGCPWSACRTPPQRNRCREKTK